MPGNCCRPVLRVPELQNVYDIAKFSWDKLGLKVLFHVKRFTFRNSSVAIVGPPLGFMWPVICIVCIVICVKSLHFATLANCRCSSSAGIHVAGNETLRFLFSHPSLVDNLQMYRCRNHNPKSSKNNKKILKRKFLAG